MLLAACAPPEGSAPRPAPEASSIGPFAAERDRAAPAGPSGDAAHGDACNDAVGGNVSSEAPAALRRVPSEEVCMRSNRFMGKPQLPTEIEGRAYFGCCAGCTKGLNADAAARSAKDPVTGRPVDKASAVIGARPDNSVVYFESEETFTRAGGA